MKMHVIARFTTVLAAVASLSGCAATATVAHSFDWRGIGDGELRFKYPAGKLVDNGPNWISNPVGEQWRYDNGR